MNFSLLFTSNWIKHCNTNIFASRSFHWIRFGCVYMATVSQRPWRCIYKKTLHPSLLWIHGFVLAVWTACVSQRPGGHSITKHMGGGAGSKVWIKNPYLSKNININKMLKSYPLNILKVQSDSSKISNLGQIFIFTENCTPNYRYESF